MSSPPSGPPWRAVLVVFACFVCHMGLGYTYLFGALQADVTRDLGIDRAPFAAAAQARNYVVALASPLVGLLLVRLGARPVLAAGLVVLSAAALALSAIRDTWGLLAAALLLGVGITGVGDVTVGHAVSRAIARGRGTALGIVYTASNLGGMLMVALVAWAASEASWREALRGAAVVTAVVLLPFAWLVRPQRGATVVHSLGDAAPDSGDMDLPEALRTRSFWVLVFAHLAYFGYAVAVTEHFVSYLMDAGLPRLDAAGAWSSAVGLGIASKLLFGYVSDRIPARHGLALLLGLISLSSLMLLLAPRQPYLLLFVASFGFSYAARDVVTPLIVIECFGLRYMAKIYGAIFPTLLVGGGLGAVLGGLCFDRLGTYRPAFAGLAAWNVLALLLVVFLRRERTLADRAPDPGESQGDSA